MSTPGNPTHHLRFYIVVITLVVGAIFFLLFTNDSGQGFSITSATVGVIRNSTADAAEALQAKAADGSAASSQNPVQRASLREVEVALAFDQIPRVAKKAKVREIELHFDDLTTKISVNNDKLELNNLQEVRMRILGFNGDLNFDANGFSLDGTAKALEINDIALSSRGEIRMAFDDLAYRFLSLEEIELEELQLPRGDGELRVGEKLSYTLEEDDATLHFFNGKLLIDKEATPVLVLEGVVRGASTKGALLDLAFG